MVVVGRMFMLLFAAVGKQVDNKFSFLIWCCCCWCWFLLLVDVAFMAAVNADTRFNELLVSLLMLDCDVRSRSFAWFVGNGEGAGVCGCCFICGCCCVKLWLLLLLSNCCCEVGKKSFNVDAGSSQLFDMFLFIKINQTNLKQNFFNNSNIYWNWAMLGKGIWFADEFHCKKDDKSGKLFISNRNCFVLIIF